MVHTSVSQLQILLVSTISVYKAHKINVLHSNLSATMGKTRAVLSKDIGDKIVDLPKTNSKKFGEEVTAEQLSPPHLLTLGLELHVRSCIIG